VDEVVSLYRKTIFPVAKEGRLYGFLLLEDLRSGYPREKWSTTTVGEAMRPVAEDHFIDASAPVADAKELLRSNGLGVLAVLGPEGEFVGMVERGRVRRRS
jgi:CBS domain-containing protein